ncbi:MAG TPA: ABC transporter permease subunit, partial [Burkholderiaceae bacterium]|nr:ABC transporter permease subunit [Burkholderiaceae bacterium]
ALVESFNQELGVRRLIARGISPQLLQAIDLEEKDLAPPRARGAQLLFIVPWTALLMAAYGAFAVAIDVTAGERERGSLEPLLCNPLPISALLSAKWAAATLSAWVIVAITLAGFWVSMPFIKNPTLSALMQLHTRELAIFAVILMPFAGLMAALNMLAATFGRSYKEAQTYVSVLTMAVQFSALIPIFLASRDVAWLRLIPSIGQITVMAKTVRGEPLDLYEWLVPGLVSALGTVLCLILLARLLRKESIIFARS